MRGGAGVLLRGGGVLLGKRGRVGGLGGVLLWVGGSVCILVSSRTILRGRDVPCCPPPIAWPPPY